MNQQIPSQIPRVLEQFQLNGRINELLPFGHGHINQTFHLSNQDPESPDYLLQQINHHVFPGIAGMMGNIQKVLKHLSGKAAAGSYLYDTLKLIPTLDDNSFFKDDIGNFWRMFDFKMGTKSYEVVENEEQAFEGGKAFGSFSYGLADLDPGEFYETIPRFHDTLFRLDQLNKASLSGIADRIKRAKPLLALVSQMAQDMTEIERKKIKGALPLRITHNDTKFNNLLLDANDKAVCVVDLDTVMPGIVHYDFGDGIRTSSNLGKEGEKDLKNIQFDIGKFSAFTSGYLEGCRGSLTRAELNYLPRSGASLAFIMGIRFLADFLQGDTYYKTSYPDENYHRAASQLELARQIFEREKDLVNIVNQHA